MSIVNQISYKITDEINKVFGDKLHEGDLTVIRGIIKIELGKQPEFRENPLKEHWTYKGENV
jgi:hypothetical protein